MIGSTMMAFSIMCAGVSQKEMCVKTTQATFMQLGIDDEIETYNKNIEKKLKAKYPTGVKAATTTAVVARSIIMEQFQYPFKLDKKRNVKLTPLISWDGSGTCGLAISIGW